MMPAKNGAELSGASKQQGSLVAEAHKPPSPQVLVMGLGNVLLSDEGAGIKVIEQLQARYIIPDTIEVIDGGTMGMELISYLDGKSQVIIVDAVNAGLPPGSVTRIDNVPVFFQNRISPHQIGLVDVLALAILTEKAPLNVVLFGIEPGNLDTGLELSIDVENKLDFLLSKVVEELRSLGIPLQLKTHPKPKL